MAPYTGRAGLTGATLVRLLADMADAPARMGETRSAFADGLVQWVGWTDAIALSSALERPATAARAQDRHAQECAEYERVLEHNNVGLDEALSGIRESAAAALRC